jgi:hypothetical protein
MPRGAGVRGLDMIENRLEGRDHRGDIGADDGRRSDRRAGRRGAGRDCGAGSRCAGARAQGPARTAARRVEGADVELRHADPQGVRAHARGGMRDLGNRPDRAARHDARRQGAGKHHQLQLCRVVRGRPVGTADSGGGPHLGGRQAVARGGGRLESADRVPAAPGRRGADARSADRGRDRWRGRAGASRDRLRRVRDAATGRLREPYTVAHLRGDRRRGRGECRRDRARDRRRRTAG